jgi:hypothetical protein
MQRRCQRNWNVKCGDLASPLAALLEPQCLSQTFLFYLSSPTHTYSLHTQHHTSTNAPNTTELQLLHYTYTHRYCNIT